MDAAHLHLLLNHGPVLGTVFGLLLLGYGLLRRRTEAMRIAFVVFVVVGVGAGAAYLTGEAAEEAIEAVVGVPEALVERHEDMAFFALWSAVALGVIALGALAWTRRRAPLRPGVLVLAVALGVAGVMGYTANLGGQISHVQIRPDARVQTTDPPPARPATTEDRDD